MYPDGWDVGWYPDMYPLAGDVLGLTDGTSCMDKKE
jgi:hypothetical protein